MFDLRVQNKEFIEMTTNLIEQAKELEINEYEIVEGYYIDSNDVFSELGYQTSQLLEDF